MLAATCSGVALLITLIEETAMSQTLMSIGRNVWQEIRYLDTPGAAFPRRPQAVSRGGSIELSGPRRSRRSPDGLLLTNTGNKPSLLKNVTARIAHTKQILTNDSYFAKRLVSVLMFSFGFLRGIGYRTKAL